MEVQCVENLHTFYENRLMDLESLNHVPTGCSGNRVTIFIFGTSFRDKLEHPQPIPVNLSYSLTDWQLTYVLPINPNKATEKLQFPHVT